MKNNKKNIITNSISFALLTASYVVFIIALCLKNDLLTAVSSSLILLSLILSIMKTLTKRSRYGVLDLIELFVNFVSAVAFIVVFICAIPDANIKSVVVPVFSSVVGGLLTLTGVGVTIKYGRIEKEEDEIKKAKPIIFPIGDVTWRNLSDDKRTRLFVEIDEDNSDIKRAEKSKSAYQIDYILIANSDVSICSLYGIMINNSLIKFKYEQILSKGSNNLIIIDSDGFAFNFKEKIMFVSLLLCDLLDNIYEASIHFSIDKKSILFNSCLGITMIKK